MLSSNPNNFGGMKLLKPGVSGLLCLIIFCDLLYQAATNGQSMACQGLCSQGSNIPFPSRIISGLTCAEWNIKADAVMEQTKCDAYQSVTGAACGCDNPPRPACDKCSQYLWNNTAQFSPTNNQLCEVIMFVASSDVNVCNTYEPAIKDFCCEESCSLCSDGNFASGGNITSLGQIEGPVSGIINNPTCEQAAIVAAEWGQKSGKNSEDCRYYQAIGSTYCGCSVDENACSLCPDGAMPDASAKIPDLNITCATAAIRAALEPKGTNKCNEWHTHGLNYCGCQPIPTMNPTDKPNTSKSKKSESTKSPSVSKSGKSVKESATVLEKVKAYNEEYIKLSKHSKTAKFPNVTKSSKGPKTKESSPKGKKSTSTKVPITEPTSKAPKANNSSKTPKAEKAEKSIKATKSPKAPINMKSTLTPNVAKSSKVPKQTETTKSPKVMKSSKGPKEEKSTGATKTAKSTKATKELDLGKSNKSSKLPKAMKGHRLRRLQHLVSIPL